MNEMPKASEGMDRLLAQNIRDVLAKREQARRTAGLEQRIADLVTRFTGSMKFVYVHLGLFGGWVAVNLGWTPWTQFDPTFVILATVSSVEAIFLSTFVLISQNQMSALAEKQASLDLQVSLLTEHELTRLLQLVRRIGEQLGVQTPNDAEFAELEKDVRPGEVLDKIDRESESN